jgi:hypothetical protein
MIRKLINSSELSIRKLARKAKVPYFRLYRWHTKKAPAGRRTPELDVDAADRVYKALTGKRFIQ